MKVYINLVGHKKQQLSLQLVILVSTFGIIELISTLSEINGINIPEFRTIFLMFGAFWNPIYNGDLEGIYSGQKYLMFISHAFLHGGIIHALMNSVVLLSLGKVIGQKIGDWSVFVLFFLTAIGGAICFTIFSSAIGPMVGASGAVFGFIGIWQYWEFTFRKKSGLTLKPFFSTLLGLILVNFVIFLMLEGGLAWQAHLGGFLVGFGVGPFFSIKNNKLID
ncbi:MAG: rhomboid family intramembrane serine protease [Rhodobacteraceae bacterium]|nr:rhomboid family intramembrane serine protease [Paracoccaceae bacterium]